MCSPRLRIIALNEDTTWIIKVWSTEQQDRVTWELVRNTQPHTTDLLNQNLHFQLHPWRFPSPYSQVLA